MHRLAALVTGGTLALAGPVRAAEMPCVGVDDNDVVLSGRISVVTVPATKRWSSSWHAYQMVSAHPDYYLTVDDPFKVRAVGQSACRPDDPTQTQVKVIHFRPEDVGQEVKVTGIFLDRGLVFMPGRVCRPGKTPECVDLDDFGGVLKPWTPPRP